MADKLWQEFCLSSSFLQGYNLIHLLILFLGRWMKFSALEIQKFKQQKNPSEEVLKQWGYCNHTIYELFFLLSKMQHYQGMLLLKNFVSSKLHVLLDNCEEILKNSQLNDMGAETRYSMNQSMSLHKILAKLPNLPNIPYNELESATGNWKKENELGSGGFGTVFKGQDYFIFFLQKTHTKSAHYTLILHLYLNAIYRILEKHNSGN